MRVLHLVTSVNAGGIETWLVRMAQSLSRDGIVFDFYCRDALPGTLERELAGCGCRVFYNKRHRNILFYLLGLNSILKGNHYDVVHNHLSIHCGWPSVIVKMRNFKLMTSFHNSTFAALMSQGRLSKVFANIYASFNVLVGTKLADIVSYCSEDVKKGIGNMCAVSEDKGKIIYYGVEFPNSLSDESIIKLRDELGIDEDAQIIINVARFSYQKNHEYILGLAKEVNERISNVVFVCVGEGVLRGEIEKKIVELGLDSHVKLIGTRRDIGDLLQISNVFLFPTLWEGLPVALLEAMASNTPVLVSDVPGNSRLVKNKINGLCISLGKQKEFLNALIMLLSNKKLAAELSAAAVNTIQKDFSIEKSSERLLSCYSQILNENPR